MTRAAMNYLYNEYLLGLHHEYDEAHIVLRTDSSGCKLFEVTHL